MRKTEVQTGVKKSLTLFVFPKTHPLPEIKAKGHRYPLV
jgi:hypothetical protein